MASLKHMKHQKDIPSDKLGWLHRNTVVWYKTNQLDRVGDYGKKVSITIGGSNRT